MKPKESLGIIGLTLLVYCFTVNTITKPFSFHLLLLTLLALILIYFLGIRGKPQVSNSLSTLLVFTSTAAILLWVGMTGWFFSPFFWLLYLWGIALAFLLSNLASLAFVLVLMGTFIPNVGKIDTGFDILILVSLLTVIPLAYYLRQEYLRLKENEKKILILEKERKKFESKVEEILSNAVHNIAVELREPVNDIRQLADFIQHARTPQELEKNRQRILASSQAALSSLKEFEEGATGKRFLKTPEE